MQKVEGSSPSAVLRNSLVTGGQPGGRVEMLEPGKQVCDDVGGSLVHCSVRLASSHY